MDGAIRAVNGSMFEEGHIMGEAGEGHGLRDEQTLRLHCIIFLSFLSSLETLALAKMFDDVKPLMSSSSTALIQLGNHSKCTILSSRGYFMP